MQKNSPTIGAYFYAEDYIKFIKNLKYYTSLDIKMIRAQDSKYSSQLFEKNQMDVPVGRLDDIEIVFLHYKDSEVAKTKWTRRCKRINWDNLIFKFSYMGNCTDELVLEFSKFSAKKKVLFVTKQYPSEIIKDAIIIPPANGKQISNDTFYFKKYINIYNLINS